MYEMEGPRTVSLHRPVDHLDGPGVALPATEAKPPLKEPVA
jgi:hypothetical protein